MKISRDRLTWREIDGEIIALDLASNTYFTANGTASVLLRRLTEEARVEDLVDALIDSYDVSADDARLDVDAFLEKLDRHGLLTQS